MKLLLFAIGLLWALTCTAAGTGCGASGPGTFFCPQDGNRCMPQSSVTNAVVQRTVSFLGGSITEMNGFRPKVMALLRKRYPDVAFIEVAAGLSSTCSDTGAFRVEKDVLEKCVPDLFVVEEAVNDDQDGHFDLRHCIRGLEGCVRRVLMKNPKCKVVIALMVNRHQYDQLGAGEVPVPYEAARRVSVHYGTAIADVGTALVESSRKGELDWAAYRDCHPSPEGCDFGARIVMDAVSAVFDPYREYESATLPRPIDPLSYFRGYEIPLGSIVPVDGWQVLKPDWESIAGAKRASFTCGTVLSGEGPGACAEVPFCGTALSALVTAGPDSGDVEVSVDAGSYRRIRLMADYGQLHYPHTIFLADDLPEGPHFARFRVVPSVRETGTGTVVRIHRLSANGPRPWKLFDRRLGMFVHWGIYSVGGFHEQERMRCGIPRDDYAKYAGRFTAGRFDADKFVAAAKSLGADYIVFTAKHHDGFCMWDTQTTDFKVTNTPCGRDVLKELAAACRRGGLKLGLYYSNPDWHHPNAYNPLSSHQVPPEKGDAPDMEKYRAYVRAQVTELLTNYGEIVCFFWDIPARIEDPEMNALVRRLQPNSRINDRGWGTKGDYSTPEREVPEGSLFPRPTEACDSVGACSWGYRVNEDYRTIGYLTQSIDAILSMGGNYLLNVGPKADGTIPAESLELLAKTGDWYGRVRESYRDVTTVTNLVSDASCFTTVRGKTVYLHYPKGLTRRGLDLSPMTRLPKSATLLNTGKALACEVVPMPRSVERLKRPCLHITGIPADELANESIVVRLVFDGVLAEVCGK